MTKIENIILKNDRFKIEYQGGDTYILYKINDNNYDFFIELPLSNKDFPNNHNCDDMRSAYNLYFHFRYLISDIMDYNEHKKQLI